MLNRKINIDTVDKVCTLVGAATSADFEVDILTDSFTVNAKSILGIFSLDRSRPVLMTIDANEGDDGVEEFFSRVGDFIVE